MTTKTKTKTNNKKKVKKNKKHALIKKKKALQLNCMLYGVSANPCSPKRPKKLQMSRSARLD